MQITIIGVTSMGEGKIWDFFKPSFLALLPAFFSCLISSCSQDKTPPSKQPDSFDKVIDLAHLKEDRGETKEAIKLVDSVFYSQQNPSISTRFRYYKFYSNYYYRITRQYDRAKLYADSMTKLVEKDKSGSYTYELAEANYSMGDILFSQKKYSEAYTYFYKAKLIAKKSSDPCNLSDYNYRLAMILYKQSRFKSAAHYFIRSYEESAACDFSFTAFYRRQELLNNTALSYSKLGMIDSALYYYQQGLKYIDSNNKKFPEKSTYYDVARGVIYGNLGQIYKLQGKPDLAEALFKKSIKINSLPNNDNRDAQLIRLNLATLYMEDKRFSEALGQMEQVKKSLAVLSNPDAELKYYDLVWKYDQAVGDQVSAFRDLIAYNKFKDSINQSSRELTEADVSEQLDNLEKQYEINFLKKDKEVNSIYFKIVVVLAIMSVIIILLILINWRRSKNNIQKLTDLNRQVMDQKIILENTLSQLEHQSQEKDRILRAVAHDLRNPIGGVASVSGLLLDEEGVTEEQTEMLQLIRNTCYDALQLINEILEITVFDQFNSLPKEGVDINTIISNTIELLRFKAVEKNQQIQLETLNDAAIVIVHRERIGRVISNLISNAIKFSPNGGHIFVSVNRVEDQIRISVRDNGIGIPDAIKAKVFDTFTEAKRLGTSGEKPFGLGLSISRQIIEAHEGKIWFESEAGKGTVFYIELQAEKELALNK